MKRFLRISSQGLANALVIVCMGIISVGVAMLFIGVITLHVGVIGLSLAVCVPAYLIASKARAYAKGKEHR